MLQVGSIPIHSRYSYLVSSLGFSNWFWLVGTSSGTIEERGQLGNLFVLREIKPSHTADVVGVEDIIEELFYYSIQKGPVVVDPVWLREREHRQAGWCSLAAKRCLKRVLGFRV